jgi:hypothetical protein
LTPRNLGSRAYSRESVSGQNRETEDHYHRTHPLTYVRDATPAAVIAYDLGPIVLNRYAAQSCTHHASICVVGNTLGAVWIFTGNTAFALSRQAQVQGAMDTFNRAWSACMEGRGYSVK